MSNTPVKVGSVSYVNAKPLIYGFEQGMMSGEVELVLDYPSAIAKQLINGDIDVGLVPVATLASLGFHQIISEYGIACRGEVASVCLFSEVPVNQIQDIWLDYQSRTSVALLKILLKEHWKVNPGLKEATAGYEKQISGTRAGLVIGDRALELRDRFPFVYDLGLAWKDLTGLPFVFAAWISNKPLPETFCSDFNKATSFGLQHLPEVISLNPYPFFNLEDYYTRFIKFKLDMDMHRAIALFLNKLEQLP